MLDSVSIARQYGASTISLTRANFDLAALSDATIGVDSPEDRDIRKPSASRLVFIAVIDVLAAGAARERPEEVREFLWRIRRWLVSVSRDTGPNPIGD